MAGARSVLKKVKTKARRVMNNEPVALSVRPTRVLVGAGITLVAAYVVYDMGRASGYRSGTQDLALAPTGRVTEPSSLLIEERSWVDAAGDDERSRQSADLMREAIATGGRGR
jgi:hypothetical protein